MEIISQQDFEEMTGHKLLVGTEECTRQQENDPCAKDCPSFLGCYKFLIYKNLLVNTISNPINDAPNMASTSTKLATKILSAKSVNEVKEMISV